MKTETIMEQKAREYMEGWDRAIRDDVRDISIIETMQRVAGAYQAIGIVLNPPYDPESIWHRWHKAFDRSTRASGK